MVRSTLDNVPIPISIPVPIPVPITIFKAKLFRLLSEDSRGFSRWTAVGQRRSLSRQRVWLKTSPRCHNPFYDNRNRLLYMSEFQSTTDVQHSN